MAESQELATGETTESNGLTPEEIEEFQGLTREESDDDLADRPSENPSVRRCIRAWNLTRDKAMAEDDDTDAAELEAKSAYLRSMPPLAGFENVRDFIACISYAQVADLIQNYEAVNLLASAKVALAAVRQEGRLHAIAQRPGRLHKSIPEEGIK
jgi:hypothetical protein